MRKLFSIVLCLFVVGGMAMPVRGAFVRGDDDQNISDTIPGDAFLGGRSIKVNKDVQGELFAVANNLTVSGKGNRSLFLAASNVTVDEGTAYNSYVAGNNVTLRGEYGHDVYVMGNTITLDKDAVIRGELHVIGGDVALRGTIAGNVFVMTQTFTSEAAIGGLLNVEADSITFDGGSVAKDFTYTSKNDAKGLDKVEVAGVTNRKDVKDYDKGTGSPIGTMVYSFLSSLALGFALLALARRMSREVILETRHAWMQSLLYGISALFAVPIIILLVALTVIGIKLAFVIGLLYAALLFIAGVLGMLLVGDTMMKQLAPSYEGSIWLNMAIGVLAVTALRALPFVGGWLGFLFFAAILIPTLGSLVSWLGKQLS